MTIHMSLQACQDVTIPQFVEFVGTRKSLIHVFFKYTLPPHVSNLWNEIGYYKLYIYPLIAAKPRTKYRWNAKNIIIIGIDATDAPAINMP
jgi:hypothetical protein